MAWNKPGGDGSEQDPWGGGNKNQGPPDLDKILRDFFNKLRGLGASRPGSTPSAPRHVFLS
jgi:membrane protease subunit HflK